MFKRFRSLFITFAILGSLVILTGTRYGTPTSTTPSIVDDGVTISISNSIVPDTNDAYDLGTSALAFRDVYIEDRIVHQNDTNTNISFTSDVIELETDGVSGIFISIGEFDPGGIRINRDGDADGDFEVSTDTVTDALFIDAGNEEAAWSIPLGHDNTAVALGAAAVTFAAPTNFLTVTGDGGTNTIATITSGIAGETLILLFTDALVTITDDDSHGADSIDLNAAFSGADDTTLVLLYDGTSWYELSRSVN